MRWAASGGESARAPPAAGGAGCASARRRRAHAQAGTSEIWMVCIVGAARMRPASAMMVAPAGMRAVASRRVPSRDAARSKTGPGPGRQRARANRAAGRVSAARARRHAARVGPRRTGQRHLGRGACGGWRLARGGPLARARQAPARGIGHARRAPLPRAPGACTRPRRQPPSGPPPPVRPAAPDHQRRQAHSLPAHRLDWRAAVWAAGGSARTDCVHSHRHRPPWREPTYPSEAAPSPSNVASFAALHTVGLVVEYSPATGETRVRFPDGVVIFFFAFFAFLRVFFCFLRPDQYPNDPPGVFPRRKHIYGAVVAESSKIRESGGGHVF